MRLHDRYLLRELLTPLAFIFGAFLILGVALFFKEQLSTIQEHHLDTLEALAYCATSLPEFLVLILPIVLLLALLYVLTQHARHNEITALRAAGISLWRLCTPYFATGLLASAAYFALNETVVPNCARWAQAILDRHATGQPANNQPHNHSLFNARARRVWTFLDYDERTSGMQNPTVEWTLPDHSWRLLRADFAVRTNRVWWFYNAHLSVDTGLTVDTGRHTDLKPIGPTTGVWTFASGGLTKDADVPPAGLTNLLAVPEFDETPERIRLLLKFADTQTLHASGNADIPLAELWKFMRNNPGLRPEDAQALATKFFGRLAMPWTCFVAVLVAIPFGAQSGRRNLFFGVAGSLFIGFSYFILQRISLALGMNGQLPGWLAAWLPNLVFAATGILLTLRVR